MAEKININSKNRKELIDITEMVRNIVLNSKVKNGICVLYVPHTTAGIIVNENCDPDVKTDILKKFSDLADFSGKDIHAEGNSDAHVQASLAGTSAFLIIENGNLILGKWQGIFFAEFDGPRKRYMHIIVK